MHRENTRILQRLSKLESENAMLKGSNVTFTFPVSPSSNELMKQFEPHGPAGTGNYSPPLSDHSSLIDSLPPISVAQPELFLDDFTLLPPKAPSPSTDSGLPTPISTRAHNIMQQYHDYNSTKSNVPIARAEDGHNILDCPKVWEKIVTHPRFDEVEIDELCAELNAKVKIVVPFVFC
jgi:hypothetical protein